MTAIARGAYEAGVKVSAAYPGTPSTEISESLVRYRDDLYCEWSPNEKVATEVAIGASIAGTRAMSCMKHVGFNVAADPAYTVSYMGVNGGPRHRGGRPTRDCTAPRTSRIPGWLQGRRSFLCWSRPTARRRKNHIKMAFDLSEQFDRPFVYRTTTRLAPLPGTGGTVRAPGGAG